MTAKKRQMTAHRGDDTDKVPCSQLPQLNISEQLRKQQKSMEDTIK